MEQVIAGLEKQTPGDSLFPITIGRYIVHTHSLTCTYSHSLHSLAHTHIPSRSLTRHTHTHTLSSHCRRPAASVAVSKTQSTTPSSSHLPPLTQSSPPHHQHQQQSSPSALTDLCQTSPSLINIQLTTPLDSSHKLQKPRPNGWSQSEMSSDNRLGQALPPTAVVKSVFVQDIGWAMQVSTPSHPVILQ